MNTPLIRADFIHFSSSPLAPSPPLGQPSTYLSAGSHKGSPQKREREASTLQAIACRRELTGWCHSAFFSNPARRVRCRRHPVVGRPRPDGESLCVDLQFLTRVGRISSLVYCLRLCIPISARAHIIATFRRLLVQLRLTRISAPASMASRLPFM